MSAIGPTDDADIRGALDHLDDLRRGIVDPDGHLVADLGTCPYFARFMALPGHNPAGACTFGCTGTVARCVAELPAGGWPSHPGVIGVEPPDPETPDGPEPDEPPHDFDDDTIAEEELAKASMDERP